MNIILALIVLASITYSQASLGFASYYYMGLQAGSVELQDQLKTSDLISAPSHSSFIQQQHRGITFGPNFGTTIGKQFLFDRWTLGLETRITLSQFNHTRLVGIEHTNINEFYTLKHVTKFNNLHLLLFKPGYSLPSNGIIYTQLGFGLSRIHISTFQNLRFNQVTEGIQFAKGQLLPSSLFGIGLELMLLPNIALYYDFNVVNFKQLKLTKNQHENGLLYHSTQNLHQFLFQAILGIKWLSYYKFHPMPKKPLQGWYVGGGLGFMQANTSQHFKRFSEAQIPFTIISRSATLSPDLELKIGHNFTIERFICFIEAFTSYHPIQKNENPQIQLSITPNDNGTLIESFKTRTTYGMNVKPGLSFLNRVLFLSLGVGKTHVQFSENKSAWPFLYLTGWGLETNMHSNLNLRAEYQLAFANRVADNHSGAISTKPEKLVQQKGNLNLIYYFI